MPKPTSIRYYRILKDANGDLELMDAAMKEDLDYELEEGSVWVNEAFSPHEFEIAYLGYWV